MGQEISQHELYVEQTRKALKTPGVKVKIHHLLSFFNFIKELCPWFPQEGTIDEKRWRRVGDALRDFYRILGPEKVPVTAFSYGNLINEMISTKCSPIAEVVEEGEKKFKRQSKERRKQKIKLIPLRRK